ncbi:MAG: hypothetical protein J2P57_04495, partial [Acidimicrobiaceae bacterium]|nr:hypothetical protein [Acidimicrobiaceae bacterium]
AVSAVTRAFANLANEMADAGYSDAEAEEIRKEIAHYVDVRAEVKLGAGEDVDFKQYEAGSASCSTPTFRRALPKWSLTSKTPV